MKKKYDLQGKRYWVTLVAEDGAVLGEMHRLEAHTHPAQLHRAVSVFLFRKNDAGHVELLTQKRSSKKFVAPLHWANTICGNVTPVESFEQCAHRRLEEELGIVDQDLQQLLQFVYEVEVDEEIGENEFDTLFAGWVDTTLDVQLNPDEVADTKWVPWNDIHAHVAENSDRYAPWFLHFLQRDDVMSALQNFIENTSFSR